MDEARYRSAEQTFWATTGIEPTERLVPLAVSGTNVRVQEVGSGEPVVFIHGGPNAGSTWVPIVEHFAGFRCLIVDRPGTGLSESYSITDPAAIGDRFVGDLLDALDLEQSHVVVSSFGGYLALRSAAADPGRIRRMVQMACPAFVPGMMTPPFMKMMSVTAVRRILEVLPPNERVGKSILRQIGHGASIDAGKIPDSFFAWYLALQKYTDTMRNDGDMIGRGGSFWGGFDDSLTLPDELLASVAAPTLFLWGADDAFGSEAVAQHVVTLMPDAELQMIPDAGHLPWLDDPEGIGAASAAFLAA